MLVHTWRKSTGNLPNESTPTDMAALARRYPEGRFQMAHFGGDWEFGLRAIRSCPNVWADFSGSVNEYGAYELAIELLGEDRIVFGTDLPADFHLNLGRVLQGGWPSATLQKILAGNFESLLGRPLTA
jgi:predicted TIM-barrel fold metal-dependent hydrolase